MDQKPTSAEPAQKYQKAIAAFSAEAATANLRVERVEVLELGADSVRSALGHFFGSYEPNRILMMKY